MHLQHLDANQIRPSADKSALQPAWKSRGAVWMFLVASEAHARRAHRQGPVAQLRLPSPPQLSRGRSSFSVTFNQDGRGGRAAHTPRQNQAVTEPDEDI